MAPERELEAERARSGAEAIPRSDPEGQGRQASRRNQPVIAIGRLEYAARVLETRTPGTRSDESEWTVRGMPVRDLGAEEKRREGSVAWSGCLRN